MVARHCMLAGYQSANSYKLTKGLQRVNIVSCNMTSPTLFLKGVNSLTIKVIPLPEGYSRQING